MIIFVDMSIPYSTAFTTVALCSAANFINAADRVIMPIAIVQMTDHYNWNLHGQGWVLSAFAVGYISSMVILTTFNDRDNLFALQCGCTCNLSYTRLYS